MVSQLQALLTTLIAAYVVGCCGQSVTLGSGSACYCLKNVLEEDLYNPVNVIFYKDSDATSNHVLVVEQRGVVSDHTIGGEEAQARNLLDITDRVVVTNDYGESRGLLSMVRDPKFAENGRVFAYYIREDGGEEYAYISRFTMVNNVIDPSTELILLRVHQPFKHGNGGPMMFGTDGYLYVVTGDGGEEDDPMEYAQRKNTFHGKVLRLDVSGGQQFVGGVAKLYDVPEDNPFVGESETLPEIYALGFRNMWGCSQDSRPGGTGRIFCAETGTDRFDEINMIEAGKNYGWNIKEGNVCHNSQTCGSIENEGVPIHNFAHNTTHALVGGFVYRGSKLDWMAGKSLYTFGDVVSGKTYILEENDKQEWKRYDWPICQNRDICPTDSQERPLTHLLAFGQDTLGELYLVMTNALIPTSKAAKLFKVVPSRENSSACLSSSLLLMVLFAVAATYYKYI